MPVAFAEEARVYAISPEAGVFDIASGRAERNGTCRDRWGRLVPWNSRSLPHGMAERTRAWNPRGLLDRLPLRHGAIASLAHPEAQGWFHWLFDVLPRLALVEGMALDAIYLDQSLPFQRETWAMLDGASPLIDAGQHARLRAERLIVPSAPSTSGVMPPWVCAWLRKRLLPHARSPSSHPPRRLYVSRQGAGRGRVRNAQQVEAVLLAHGFETVFAERLSVADQIGLFSQAAAVVGPHGAGLANLVFAPPGCRVLELFAPTYLNVCYWTLASQVDLRYTFLLGREDTSNAHKGRPDIEVPLAQLEQQLCLLEE